MAWATPWPGIGADPIRGSRLATLLFNFPLWVHRRVDSIVLGPDGTTRRSISFDLTMPAERAIHAGPMRSGERTGKLLVPLALIEKGALRRASSLDPAGKPLPVLGSEDNGQLTLELLKSLVQPAKNSEDYEGDVGPILERIVRHDPGNSGMAALEASWAAWLGQATFPPLYPEAYRTQLDNMVRAFIDNFLLVVELDEDYLDRRCVLKFAYDRDLPVPAPGDHTTIIGLTLPDVGFAKSQHVEVEVPAGLRLRWLEVTESIYGEPVGAVTDEAETERSVGHVAFRARSITSSATVLFAVSPVRSGIFAFTLVASLAVLTFAILTALQRAHWIDIIGHPFAPPSPAVSLLLIGPALFLSWMAKAPEHRVSAVVLAPLRWILLVCTLALVIGGFAVAVPLATGAWNTAWTAVLVLAVLGTLLLIGYWKNVLGALIRRLLS